MLVDFSSFLLLPLLCVNLFAIFSSQAQLFAVRKLNALTRLLLTILHIFAYKIWIEIRGKTERKLPRGAERQRERWAKEWTNIEEAKARFRKYDWNHNKKNKVKKLCTHFWENDMYRTASFGFLLCPAMQRICEVPPLPLFRSAFFIFSASSALFIFSFYAFATATSVPFSLQQRAGCYTCAPENNTN